eukprot:TRINITY_DN1858_c0_g2_i1.p1 TRINITY_DN1858_c0_g2~~TRINITY_DN1858_c0_g2_i1.p1  ORF type:complete len:406 (+),score=109.47 TRINITY_DN1858_c0_g2_i1:543-1760(+)
MLSKCIPCRALLLPIRKRQHKLLKLQQKLFQLSELSKLLQMRKKVISDFADKLKEPQKKAIKMAVIQGVLNGLSQGFTFFSMGLAWWYGGYIAKNEGVSFLNVMTVITTIMMASQSIGNSLSGTAQMSKAKVAAGSIFDLVDSGTLVDAASDLGDKPKNVVGDISVENVVFSYPSRPGVIVSKSLSLKIPAGKVTALVGPSGCGKSSLIGMLQRFYLPNSGEIKLDGQNINTFNVKWWREQMGLVSQEPILFAGTIGTNIAYGKENATQEDIEEAAKAANAHNFITGFPAGYNTEVGERGVQLSGGQKQRIAIARAIIRNPKILLLDEATSALDTESEKIVQEALDSVQVGRTTIVIAHRLSTIKDADNIAVIDNGKVVEQGTHNQLMDLRGLYYALATRQQQQH